MGIRLVCPNGHQLHVKAELAGRRGICPHCKAPVEIPAEEAVVANPVSPVGSGDSVDRSVLLPTLPAPTSPPPAAPVTAATPTAVPPTPPPPPTPKVEAPEWYVRTPEGEQYGPATATIFGQWIEEGRVTDDSYVWKAGWPDWLVASKCAGELPRPLGAVPKLTLPNLPTAVAVTTSAAMPSVVRAAAAPTPVAADPSDPAAIAAHATQRLQRKRRQAAQRQAIIAGVLGLMAIVLGVVLMVVLYRGDKPAKPAAANPTATTTNTTASAAPAPSPALTPPAEPAAE